MKEYKESIELIQKSIQKKLSDGTHVVIVGDNAVGKSDILKKLVQSYIKNEEDLYFIDAVNRKFDITFASSIENKVVNTIRQIVDRRLNEGVFNLADSFGNSEGIERIYKNYELQLKQELKKLVGIDFEIRQRNNEITGIKNAVFINSNEVLLSNGYQAIVRLLLELIYFEDSVGQDTRAVIVIDEIDKYLSPLYTAKIFPYLQGRFPNYIFCVSTHARDLLKYASNYILCPLMQDTEGKVQFEFISYTDIKNERMLERIFCDMFFVEERKETSSNEEIDTRLRQFLNLKLMDSWDEALEEEFQNMQSDELAPHQKLLYRQIKEW